MPAPVQPAATRSALASADPTSRAADAADLAAVALDRYRREQDAAPGLLARCLHTQNADGIRAALATSRGEAARAVEALGNTMPAGSDEETEAHTQWLALLSSDAIPSATLAAWAAGWRTYGAAS